MSIWNQPHMTENIRQNLINKNEGVLIASSVQKQLIKISGTLTSQIQLKGENTKEPYYYAFIRLKGQNIDLPVIFKVKENKGKTIPCPECNYPKKGNWEKQFNCQTKQIEHKVAEVWIKPHLKKSDEVELTGHYSNSPHSIRKSFTATSYQLFNHKKVRKKPHDYLNQPEENIFAK